MRIDEFFLECAVFLCRQTKTLRDPFATAFFVDWTDANGFGWRYVVTARHCIEDVPTHEIFVRVNYGVAREITGYRDIPTRKDDWFKHDSADVAMMRYDHQDDLLKFHSVPFGTFIDGEYRFRPSRPFYRAETINALRGSTESEVKIGDDVFFTGLFAQSAGSKINLPIARFGNVSRMPSDELIGIETRARGPVKVRAYLAECRSWSGHSGSPAFWYYPLYTSRPVIGAGTVFTGKNDVMAFLGLVSGHFDIEKAAKVKTDAKRLITELNAGIAIITPAANIAELFMRDDVEEDRKKVLADSQRKQRGATADFLDLEEPKQKTLAKKPEDRIDIPIPTRGRFERDLAKAIRKRDKK